MHRLTVVSLGIALGVVAEGNGARYLRWPEAQRVLALFASTGDPAGDPTGDKVPAIANGTEWDAWIRQRDGEVRGRIERGVEDSISNLVMFGTSFTTLPRIGGPSEAVTAGGELTPAAQKRVEAFAQAFPTLGTERFRFGRQFLKGRVANDQVQAVVSANLRRFANEQNNYQRELATANASGDKGRAVFVQSTLFEHRGLSSDTSLLPNLALEDTLRVMKKKGVLPAQVRRIAIIGPGLDFTDKRDGYDFYPLQTIQPFAVMEAVLRLGLADPGDVRVVAFELNPAVLAHVNRLSERARAGQRYVLQLPRDPASDWNDASMGYWRQFGDVIGTPVAPLPVPSGLRGVELRAVAVKPQLAARVSAADLNIVAQTMDPAAGEGFDLVVATNILYYYGRFEQVLAMANVAQMMNPGGIFLSNTVLPAQRPDALAFLGRRSVTYSSSGAYGDDVVVYRRR
jgi:hypothetical protein